MPDPPFAKGLNNLRYNEEIITRTRRRIEECAQAGIPAVIAFNGFEIAHSESKAKLHMDMNRPAGWLTGSRADARRIARAIFWRPVAQVGVGIVVGGALLVLLVATISGDLPSARQALLVALYSIAMMAVCLLACVVPTRRALSVQPTHALKGEC